MNKVIGIVLLVGSGLLGYMSYEKYQSENSGKDALNKSIIGSVVTVKKEVPTATYLLGLGSVIALGVGITLVLKK